MNLLALLALSCTLHSALAVFSSMKSVATTSDRQHVKLLWNKFKLRYDRVFANFSSERQHFRVFRKRLRLVDTHEKLFRAGKVSFCVELNEFADQEKPHSHLPDTFLRQANGSKFEMTRDNVSLPESVDWRVKGAVTTVKNQGNCGACYAFAAVGALEGQNAIKHNKHMDLSVQNVVDCSSGYGNLGCSGGDAAFVYQYVKDYGLDSEQSYPYVAESNLTCRFTPRNVEIRIDGFQEVTSEDEEALKKAVATMGPVSAAVNTQLASFDLYKSGVYYDPKCEGQAWNLSHMILVVGYGTDPQHGDFWILKNSRGVGWGEKGYMRLARNRQNHCGIATAASFPVIQKH